MICSFKTMTVMLAGNGVAFLMTTDRDGMEQDILKEKESTESHRKYYCTNCKEYFKGEEESDWIKVKEHFGKKAEPETPDWLPAESEIIDLADINLDDPNLRPTIKKQLQAVLSVFGDGDDRL